MGCPLTPIRENFRDNMDRMLPLSRLRLFSQLSSGLRKGSLIPHKMLKSNGLHEFPTSTHGSFSWQEACFYQIAGILSGRHCSVHRDGRFQAQGFSRCGKKEILSEVGYGSKW